MNADASKDLLEEIRDLQREHLEEYRRVTQRSLELQEKAVLQQRNIARIYRWAVAAGGVLVAGIVLLIIYLLESLALYL